MEKNDKNIDSNESKDFPLFNIIKKFLSLSDQSNVIIPTLNEIKPIFSVYCKHIILLYIDDNNEFNIKVNKIRKRNINYIIKKYVNENIINNKRYMIKSGKKKSLNLLFMKILLFCFAIFREVCKCKNSDSNSHKKNTMIFKLDKILSLISTIICKLYTDNYFNNNQFEISLKFLLILSISFRRDEKPNKNDRIENMMFFKECIEKLKLVYHKIYESTKTFSLEQENIFNNILLFIIDSIIAYSNQKPISIINKSYLSHNDYYTTSLIDLIFLISKMKKREVINTFIELLKNIYCFSFRYNNLMNPMIKILEPLFININFKTIDDIDKELNIVEFPLKFLIGLIEKEENILKEDPTFLATGFYLGNKVCGISGEIEKLKEEYLLIFGFSLHEINNQINNIKEWTLINIRNNKDKESQFKIWLSQINGSRDEYSLMISSKNDNKKTKIVIKSKKTYIFSFLIKSKKIKICYTCESDAYPIHDTDEIDIKNFNTENTTMYIGCDINIPNNLLKESNTFTGFIGTLIILNQKKLDKKNQDEIPKLILGLKGDYASAISMALENENYNCSLIDKTKKYNFKNKFCYKQTQDNIIKLNGNDLKFIESIKGLISPFSFRLVEYKDEIDYLNLENNYELYEDYKKENTSLKQNYLDFSLNIEKKIEISTSFFNNRFHIFENKNTLEEFIKYDGIHYLCLIFEYYYQILCKLNELNNNKNIESSVGINIKSIYKRIGNDIYDLFEFFVKIIETHKKFCENFIKEINQFLYQISITIKKFMLFNDLDKKFSDLILSLMKMLINYIQDEPINESNNYLNELKKLRNKTLDLLQNVLLIFINEEKFIENLNFYIDIMDDLIRNGKINDLFSKQFSDKVFFLSYIFDNSYSFVKNNKNSFKNLQEKYSNLLMDFLKVPNDDCFSKSNKPDKNETKKLKTSIFSFLDKKNKNISKIEEKKEEKIKDNLELLNYYMEYTLQTLTHPYIFSNLLNILYKLEIIEKIPAKYIEKIQCVLELHYNQINENKKSQLISESSLRLLSAYYLVDKEKEKLLHNFLKGLAFYKGFFYSVISSLKQIKYITEDNKYKKETEKIIRKTSSISCQSDDTDSTYFEQQEKNYAPNNLDLLPLLDLDIINLNKKQNHILITLLQDCISMFFYPNTNKIYEKININEAQDVYDTLIKNFEYVLKQPNAICYYEIFSSDKEITSKLFYFKWKLSDKEKKELLIKDLKIYHEKLLLNHSFPFIFQFILLINLDEENKQEVNEKIKNENNNFIVDLLCFIYDELDNFYKENDSKNENYYFFICNTINFLILLNKLFANEILFKYNSLQDLFFKLIDLLINTGLLYSNYCFEIEEKNGKIISEICYDLYIYLLDYSFQKDINKNFIDTFIIENKQQKEKYSIFYLMDLNKEEIIDKDKNTKKELQKIISEYTNLRYIHKNIFVNKDPKKKTKIFGKKINAIEGINFTIYFLSKTFLYLNSIRTNELKKTLLEIMLHKIAEDIFKLWTKQSLYYGHKICKRFLLYSETKSFFEAHVIQEPTNFDNYIDFFEKDIPIKLKGQNKLTSCFSSRLLDKKEYDLENNTSKEGDNHPTKKANTFNLELNTSNIKNIYSLTATNCFFSFENIEKKYIIYNPKNYLIKRVFSSSFQDALFKDKLFQKIKSSYLCKYHRNKTLRIRSKQLNYPVRQKNFSNSLEPKTFICKDNKFYKKEFFSVSHKYINPTLIKETDINALYFYPHEYLRNNNKKESQFDCELVTNQFLYSGKMYIDEEFIFFTTEKAQREKGNLEDNYKYIFSTKDNENKTDKMKSFIIFIKEIKEVIARRTLLMKQSIEIFIKNGKSFFFNLFKTKICDEIFNVFNGINQNLLLKNKPQINLISKDIKLDVKKITTSFKKGEITNYEYLLYLNKLSTRTYNDLTQYPILPWLVLKNDTLYSLTNNDEPPVENNIITNCEEGKELCYLRDLNYPVSMQNNFKREEEIIKYNEDSKTTHYSFHCGTHYSTSSYIFYYLMRINPFGQNLIKLQNYKQENPNRMFLSFRETYMILESSTDNRELIPDIYCYIDYLCNINCSYLGKRNNNNLVDDFYINNEYLEFDKNTNILSSYVESLYRLRKLLNHKTNLIKIDKWVDIIFGTKQFPPKEEASNSCNLFSKYSYEQNINLEEKLEKFKGKLKKGEIDDSTLKSKMQNKINIINNFGICPCQILNENIIYEPNLPSGNNKIKSNKNNKRSSNNYYYFTKINKNQYLSINKNSREIAIYQDNIDKAFDTYKYSYNFESDLSPLYINTDYSLYKPNYLITDITITNELNKKKEVFLIICRFLGNYFKVIINDKCKNDKNNNNKSKMILCEDFVTSVNKRNSSENDNIFFTGLKNGKLTEWKLKIIYSNNSNHKKKNQTTSSFTINEKKHVYAHKSSITAIEIFNKKSIIATAGEDKFIFIRKLYDFELLTSIDLTYSFGNPIVSNNPDIFPSLIKISDLNLIYILLYNYKIQKTVIRGYTLNGLFFAETDMHIKGTEDSSLSFNSISFNKNWNLIVGLYNFNQIILLNSYDLKAKPNKRFVDDKNKHYGTKYVEYDPISKEFLILYDNECKIITLNEEKDIFDS